MKTFFSLVSTAIVFLFLSTAPASAQRIPPEVRAGLLRFFRDMSNAVTVLENDMDKANAPQAIAQALNNFTRRIEPVAHNYSALVEKHSGFFERFNQREGDVPSGDAELDNAAKAFENQLETLGPIMMRIIPHLGDVRVRTAFEKMQQIMDRIGGEDEDEEDDDE